MQPGRGRHDGRGQWERGHISYNDCLTAWANQTVELWTPGPTGSGLLTTTTNADGYYTFTWDACSPTAPTGPFEVKLPDILNNGNSVTGVYVTSALASLPRPLNLLITNSPGVPVNVGLATNCTIP